MKGLTIMLKIFSTQLTGIIKNITNDEFSIEDAARLLAQSTIGEGHIYICGLQEMAGVAYEATQGIEALPYFKVLSTSDNLSKLSSADRVLLITRYHNDEEAIQLAKQLSNQNIPFVALSTVMDPNQPGLQDLADIHINLHLKRGLVPTETGERIGYPSLLIALYTFHNITLTLRELLEELQE